MGPPRVYKGVMKIFSARVPGILVLLGVFALSAYFLTQSTRSSVAAEGSKPQQLDKGAKPKPLAKIKKSDGAWKKQLTDSEFRIMRRAGTERAFSGTYWNTKDNGTYFCRGCGLELFSADHKFKSGTGWPSFYQPVHEHHVETEEDRKYGMSRTEIHCARCDSHLGHVFRDGPKPTGLRYCVNSASLYFSKKTKPTPKK